MQGTIGCWCNRHRADKTTALRRVFIMVRNGEPRLLSEGKPIEPDSLFCGMTPHFLVTVPTINTPAELAELVKVCVPPDREVLPYERSVAYEYLWVSSGQDISGLVAEGWRFLAMCRDHALFDREVLVKSKEGDSK